MDKQPGKQWTIHAGYRGSERRSGEDGLAKGGTW